jgi:hypothetical protein
MTNDEIITTAMLLGGEFTNDRSSSRLPLWRCYHTTDGGSSGAYWSKADAAAGFLAKRGYEFNFIGELVKL